jgi:hypothetical protein
MAWTYGAGLWGRASLSKALLVTLLLLTQPGAMAKEHFVSRVDRTGPRDVFFSNHVLYSAQAEVVLMTTRERRALQTLLDGCSDVLSADQARRLRCEIAMQGYLIEHRKGRDIDRLLDSLQFMTSMIRYSKTIGRQSEAGLQSRLGSIHYGLRDAIRVAPPIGPEASNELPPPSWESGL